MCPQASDHTKLVSPRDAIDIAWARTDDLSTNVNIRGNAERVKKRMDDIIEIADKGTNVKEKEYINSVFMAIESTYRSLATIANGRTNNYKEIDAVRDQQAKDMQSFASLIPTLQSTIPRIAEMTIGGIATGTLFGPYFIRWFPSLGDYAFHISVAIGAVLLYLVSELFINPWLAKRKLRSIIQLDYDKDLYYQQYLIRTKNALISLYDQVEDLHEKNFNTKYSEEKNSETEVDDLLKGLSTTMCENVVTCIKKNKITANNWAICETGETKKDCKEHKIISQLPRES